MRRLAFALAFLAAVTPSYAYLYDTGGPSETIYGYGVSGDPGYGWSIWHTFQLPPGLWRIDTLGIAGFTLYDNNLTGMRATFHPDAEGMPDLDHPIGRAAPIRMPFDTGHWTDVAVGDVILEGEVWYWVGFDGDERYNGAIHPGDGPGVPGAYSAMSVDGGRTFEYPHDPIASMRIDGERVPNIRVQTDWSVGPGESGPDWTWGSTFDGSLSLAWRSIPGQLAVRSFKRAVPQQHIVVGDADLPECIAVGDLNGDGRDDLITNDAVTYPFDPDNERGAIYWWENLPEGGWAKHTADDDFLGAWHVDTADIDRDGDLDIIATAYFGNVEPPPPPPTGRNGRYAWFENLYGDGSAWEKHEIAFMFWGARYIQAGDIDGDGDIDLAGASELTDGINEQDSDVTWFENLDGDGDEWFQHDIDEDIDNTFEVHLDDIDGDGDIDIVAAPYDAFVWYENVDGTGSTWTRHTITTAIKGAGYADVGDVDNDGDLDLVGSGYNTDVLAWFENLNGDGSAWQARAAVALPGGYNVQLADLEGDGDLDALVSSVTGSIWSGVWWIENTSGDGSSWGYGPYKNNFEPGAFAVVGDPDCDGKLDEVVSVEDPYKNETQQISWFDVTTFDVEGGELTSTILDGGGSPDWGVISWDAQTPPETSLVVQIRTSDDPGAMGPFVTIPMPGVYLGNLVNPTARYLQYRLLLDSDDSSVSPIVREVRVEKNAMVMEMATPPDYFTPGWNWFSIPLAPVDDSAAAIFDPYDVTNKLFRWDPVAKNLELYPDDFTALAPDESYMLKADNVFGIAVQGFPIPPDQSIVIPAAGWMWIGYPRTGETLLADVTVKNLATMETRTAGEDFEAPDSWLNWNWLYYDAVAKTVRILALSGGDDDTLHPWFGYRLWANRGDTEVTYAVP